MATRQDQIITARKDKLEKLIALGVNVNPPVYKPTHKAAACVAVDMLVNVAGRILGYRRQGKIAFIDLSDDSGHIQILTSLTIMGEKDYEIAKLLDIGDFVGVAGKTFRTQAGELTIEAKVLTFLGKAMSPLPDVWYGLKDKGDRFRRRYLDLILNKDAKSVLDKRWLIERSIREFLWSENYTEVETPILQNLYGGTNAKPFTTHLNALDTEMYLRIAPELYLKRLIVGGYERIFEIARNFRNEGIDQTHQPEFTMMEFYEAYADYYRIMELTEALMKYVAQKVNGSLQLQVGEREINLDGKWRQITIDAAMKEYLHIDWETISEEDIQKIMRDNKIKVEGVYTRNKALFSIYDHLITPQFLDPIWVIDYPVDVSPLAKGHRSRPGRVERFEGYVGGKEIIDGWSEIVSEREQRERFETEQKNMKAGADETQPLDQEFLEALSYGCPPLGGIGIGIDRLVMFLTNTWAIREVVAFPLLRPENTVANIPSTKKETIIPSTQEVTKPTPTGITRDQAFAIVQEFVKSESLIKHMLAVEAAMATYAKKYGEDEEVWRIAGLLHDFDWEIHPTLEEHPLKGVPILRERGVSEEIIRAILGHAPFTETSRDTKMEKALFAVDELTGLITTTALVRPSKKIGDVEVKSIKKKWKDKGFAAGVNREEVEQGATELGVDLWEEHIPTVLAAMQEIAEDLGL